MIKGYDDDDPDAPRPTGFEYLRDGRSPHGPIDDGPEPPSLAPKIAWRVVAGVAGALLLWLAGVPGVAVLCALVVATAIMLLTLPGGERE